MTGVLGVSTLQYAPWAFFNYFTPILALLYALTGFRVERLPVDLTPEANAAPAPAPVVDAQEESV
jgi:NhaC family Na+:H+ antiporter